MPDDAEISFPDWLDAMERAGIDRADIPDVLNITAEGVRLLKDGRRLPRGAMGQLLYLTNLIPELARLLKRVREQGHGALTDSDIAAISRLLARSHSRRAAGKDRPSTP